ncbi:hypothetical protein [Arthrobacter sp. RCC_34]|uniref:Gp37-like protein n=1 Tax=Arthrobacter sp. RCC_34 TaxID=3239230 RepID=UPI0035267EA8
MSESPFHIDIVSKDFRWAGVLGDALELRASPAHCAQPTAKILVSNRSKKLGLLMEEGTRLEITLHGKHFMGGPLREATGKGPASNGTIEFTLVDDYRMLSTFTGWPVPTANLDNQTNEYHIVTGPAETVLKTIVTANANRLGLPITCSPSLGRGTTITATMRFHTIEERLIPAIDAAGLGVTVRRVGPGFVVDCYQPSTYPHTLTEASGVLASWEWQRAAPEATDVIVGGSGEGVGRVFKHFSATDGRQALWNERIEVFRDASDSDDVEDVYSTRAVETFTETAQKTGLKLGLSETKNFRYGDTVRVGDRVTAEIGPGLAVTDILRQADISFTREDGLVAEPQAGEFMSADTAVAKALKKAIRAGNNLERSR